jgi:hypothetical protein
VLPLRRVLRICGIEADGAGDYDGGLVILSEVSAPRSEVRTQSKDSLAFSVRADSPQGLRRKGILRLRSG